MFRLTTTKYLVLGILDFVIIGIVIYGLTDWVYDGYPSWVPYTIIVFFLIMSTTRFYKFSSALKKSNSLDSHDLESLFSEDESESNTSDEVSPNGFRRRKSKNTTQAKDDCE